MLPLDEAESKKKPCEEGPFDRLLGTAFGLAVAVRTGRASGPEARKAVEVILAIYRSAPEGKPVKVG